MKPVKLLTLTTRNYLGIFTVLTLFFFGVFYLITKREVERSTDEILFNRRAHIQAWFRKQGGAIPAADFTFNRFLLTPTERASVPLDRYSDTLLFETVDQEWDEFRKLTTSLEEAGRFYQLEIVVPRMETHEIVESIVQSLAVVLTLMVLAFYFATRYYSGKLWEPFYETLGQLNRFEVDQSVPLKLTPGRIEEFVLLNKSIEDLTTRTRSTFIQQKQFIENASHEMQTPLAITQSKLELLIEDPNLTESQADIIQALLNSTQRLARLNKTLLLLSKLENQQFPEKELVFVEPLLKEILANFEDQQEQKSIAVTCSVVPGASLETNKTLLDLLLTNLVKNAFVHNHKNGFIRIEADHQKLIITNSSLGASIPSPQLFQRFYKQSSNPDSWGLGLAIAKKITEINRWNIRYSTNNNEHIFLIDFNQPA